MSVRKRGNRWEVRVRVGAGRRIERTLPPGATRTDALALESQIRRAQVDAAAGRKPRVTIDACLDRWIEEEARRLKSWKGSLDYKVGVLRQFTGGRYLDEIQEVAALVRRAEAAPATVNRYLSVLRRISNLARTWGLGSDTGRVVLLPERNARHVYLSAEQVEDLARRCIPEVADLIRFAAMTGLRRSEILRLTPDMIHEKAVVLDAKTKSGRPRVVPLPAQAARIASRRLPWTVGIATLRGEFERSRKAAGLPHVHFHDLRHSYASALVRAGQPLTAVRDILGHSSLAVTDRYAHLAREDLTRAVNATFKRWGKGGGKRKTGTGAKR